MGFFTSQQKKMARKCTNYELQRGYEYSDIALERASYSGNTKELKKAMKMHRDYECARLYQNMPEFKQQRKK